MKQFRIEVATDGRAHTFNITDIGDEQYQIFRETEQIGTIRIDGKEHEHCETMDCEIDLPLMNAIREGILLHLQLTETPGE
jgi:hypothetical protein